MNLKELLSEGIVSGSVGYISKPGAAGPQLRAASSMPVATSAVYRAQALVAQRAAEAAAAAAKTPAQIAMAAAQKAQADAAVAYAEAALSAALTAHTKDVALAAANAKAIAAAKARGQYVATVGKPKGTAGPTGLTNAQIDAQIAVLNQKIIDVTASGGGDINQLIAQMATLKDLKAQIAALEAQRPAATPGTPTGGSPGATPDGTVLDSRYPPGGSTPDMPPVEWKADGSAPLGGGPATPFLGPMMARAYPQEMPLPEIAPADGGYAPPATPAEAAPPAALTTTAEAAPPPKGIGAFVAAHKNAVIAGTLGVTGVIGILWYVLTGKKKAA